MSKSQSALNQYLDLKKIELSERPTVIKSANRPALNKAKSVSWKVSPPPGSTFLTWQDRAQINSYLHGSISNIGIAMGEIEPDSNARACLDVAVATINAALAILNPPKKEQSPKT